MKPLFNPVAPQFKSVVGGVKTEEILTLKIIAEAEVATLVIREDYGEKREYPMIKAGNCFSVDYIPEKSGLFWYSFLIDGKQYGMPWENYSDKQFGYMQAGGGEYQLTVSDKQYSTPDWFKGGIIYQIFPDRFKRVGSLQPRACQRLRDDWGGMPDYLPVKGEILNDDFFGGNFEGIRSALGYIKELGVTVIYLNPIFMARSNHRYDTADYMQTDNLLGDEDALKKLFEDAESLGIKVVLDGVFNHTGDDSIYFDRFSNYGGKGAYNTQNSKYYSWYNFTDYPEEYSSWWGIKILPQVNKSSPTYKKFICGKDGVVRKYLRLGASGWRLDVVDELPSDFVDEIHNAIKDEKPDAVIIGEVWENVTDKIAYGVRRRYFQGGELDSAMNYPLKNAIINYLLTKNSTELVSVIRRQIDCYPKESLNCLMNVLGTHDTARITNVLSGAYMPADRKGQATSLLLDEQISLGVQRLKIASVILYTVYGLPTIYYGDEDCMTGWADPFNRKCKQWEEKGLLYDWYKMLGEIRRKSHVFKDGDTKIEHYTKASIIFSREDADCKIYTAINLGKCSLALRFTGEATDLISGETASEFALGENDVMIIRETK